MCQVFVLSCSSWLFVSSNIVSYSDRFVSLKWYPASLTAGLLCPVAAGGSCAATQFYCGCEMKNRQLSQNVHCQCVFLEVVLVCYNLSLVTIAEMVVATAQWSLLSKLRGNWTFCSSRKEMRGYKIHGTDLRNHSLKT